MPSKVADADGQESKDEAPRTLGVQQTEVRRDTGLFGTGRIRQQRRDSGMIGQHIIGQHRSTSRMAPSAAPMVGQHRSTTSSPRTRAVTTRMAPSAAPLSGETFLTASAAASASLAPTAVAAPSGDYVAALGEVSRMLEQPSEERLANLGRFVRCVTMRFRRKAPSQDEKDLRFLMPSSLARDNEVWEYTSCAICLVDFADGEELRRTPCAGGHYFHPNCLRGWYDRSKTTCPVCRGGDDGGRAGREGPQSATSAAASATGEPRTSPESLAEYVMRRLRSGKKDVSVSTQNKQLAAKIIRTIREDIPSLPEDTTARLEAAACDRRGSGQLETQEPSSTPLSPLLFD
jgi:hypothetical protein